MPNIDDQIYIEQLYDKKEASKLIRESICESEELVEVIESYGEDAEVAMDFMIQLTLRRRMKVGAMVGILRKHGLDVHAISEYIMVYIEDGLCYLDALESVLIVKYLPPAEVLDDIAQHRALLPMVVPPKKATFGNIGYHFTNRPAITKPYDQWKGDVCLESIDRKNAIPYVLNLEVAMSITNKWAGCDKRKPLESRKDFLKRYDAWQTFNNITIQDIQFLVDEAEYLYLPHFNCKRGRAYCTGYTVSYQGNHYQKACIEFAEQLVIDDEIYY